MRAGRGPDENSRHASVGRLLMTLKVLTNGFLRRPTHARTLAVVVRPHLP